MRVELRGLDEVFKSTVGGGWARGALSGRVSGV